MHVAYLRLQSQGSLVPNLTGYALPSRFGAAAGTYQGLGPIHTHLL